MSQMSRVLRVCAATSIAVFLFTITRSPHAAEISESLARGHEWLRKAADLAGGANAWAAIKSVAIDYQGVISVNGQDVSLTGKVQWKLPDHYLLMDRTPTLEVGTGFDGLQGWRVISDVVSDDPSMRDNVNGMYAHSLFCLFSDSSAIGVEAQETPRMIDGSLCQAACVKRELPKNWVIYFGPDGSLSGMDYETMNTAGEKVMVTEIYKDWKAVNGVKYPHNTAIMLNGTKYAVQEITSLVLNPTLPDSLFGRPESTVATSEVRGTIKTEASAVKQISGRPVVIGESKNGVTDGYSSVATSDGRVTLSRGQPPQEVSGRWTFRGVNALSEDDFHHVKARTRCVIRQVPIMPQTGKEYRMISSMALADNGQIESSGRLIYSQDTTFANTLCVKIGANSYVLIMERIDDQVELANGMVPAIGAGSVLRFDANDWVGLLGANYRGGAVAISDSTLEFFSGTEKVDEKGNVFHYNGRVWLDGGASGQ